MRYSLLATVCRMGQTLLEAAQYLRTAPQNAPREELMQNGRQMLAQMRSMLELHRADLCSGAPLARLAQIETLWEHSGQEQAPETLEPLLAQFMRELPQQARYQVRAVFFAELGEKWDAMQSVYEFMRADPRFDPVVVRTPVFRVVQQSGKREQETIYRDFLTPMGIPSLGYDAYDLAADCPELAFISQPYESCTLPQFWPENIAKHTRLIYLPYYLPYTVAGHDDITAMAQMPVHRFAWKVACSGKKHYAFYCRHAENRGANALVTGLPKTDPIVAARQKPPSLPDGWEALNGKTVFLWNSWYSIGASSLRYFDVLLEWFRAHGDCALIWRPHPMCDTVTKLYYPDQYPAWQEMLRQAEAAENVLVDRETSFLAAFSASHAMVSDTSSMLPQYLLFDKPTLWTRSRLTGEEFIDCRWMEQAGRAEDILAFLERVRDHEDRNAALRTAICKRDLPLADGHCGERVCEAVWNALQEESRA